MSRQKILVVDHKPQIRRTLRSVLAKRGYSLTVAGSGEEAVRKLRRERFDLIIWDRNVPDIGLLESRRQIGSSSGLGIGTPTMRMREAAERNATNSGGHAVRNSFSVRRLLKRIRATLRRHSAGSSQEEPVLVSFGKIVMNFDARHVSVSGKDVRLTPKEFLLLRYMIANPNRAIPHANLLKAVWGPDYGREVEYLRVFVNRVRKKIETDPAKPRYILTEPWFGYRFQLPQKT